MIARRRLALGRALVWIGVGVAIASVPLPWQLGVAAGVVLTFAGMLIRDQAKYDLALIERELGPAFELKRGRR